ncbi:1-(5-phosphoribosyl)-5-[(5-phosphoribosylamino)methylideneamino]imidazole-4-carboxamide isomerase [Spirochaetota bacterium]
MLIIPAIDIRNGNCVRLLQGDPDRETVYSNDPVEMARKFEGMGAKLIHIVDLDGAFSGEPVNFDLVVKVSKSVSIPIEIGGGIRNIDTAKKYLDFGVKRVILGTVILTDEFKKFIEVYPENIVAGVDAKDSKVATHGWKKVSEVDALGFMKDLRGIGVKKFIYTDISTDGMLTGPNYPAVERILKEIDNIEFIASGGISSLDDISKLSEFEELNIFGCITGKAIYDGRVNLIEAIEKFQ